MHGGILDMEVTDSKLVANLLRLAMLPNATTYHLGMPISICAIEER
jgi:hypothetical protein